MRPGHEAGSFGGKKDPQWALPHQANRRSLFCALIWAGKPQKDFFTDNPDAVGDVVQKASPAFHAFTDDQLAQTGAPVKVGLFIMIAIAVTLKFQITAWPAMQAIGN